MGGAPRDPAIAELPPVLATIAEAIGLGAALKLAATWGGTQISVPKRMRLDHPVAKLIGIESAKALHRLIAESPIPGGDGLHRIWIPRAHQVGVRRRQRMIIDAVAAGQSKAKVALAFQVTNRWVRAVCNREPEKDERQGTLFE